LPFGEVRTIPGLTSITQTDFGYTGQRNYAYINLLDYGARWYSASLGRFTQPDSIVPDLNDTQAWNRYSYVINNPVNYTDPSGHFGLLATAAVGALIGAAVGAGGYWLNTIASGEEFDVGDAFVAAGVGALAGGLIGSGVGLLNAGAVGGLAAITGSATVSEVAAVTISTGAGIASAAGGQLAYNSITGSEFNRTSFSITSSMGAITGGIGQVCGTTPLGGGVLNGAASALEYEMQYYNENGELDLDQSTLIAAGYGGSLGALSPNTPLDELGQIKPIQPANGMKGILGRVSSVSDTAMPGVNSGVVLQNLFGPPTLKNWFREVIYIGLSQLDAEEIMID
jgi:RHS repeat-associated protein